MALRLVPRPAPAPPAPADEVSAPVLRAAAAGDVAATRAFVSCYQHRLLTVCARLLGDRRLGEDAAQESFLRAFVALPRFDPAGPARCSTWLITIATRVCLDERRRHRRRPTHDDAALGTLAAPETGAFELTAARQLERRLEVALQALPEGQREVFVLRVLAERSVEETAAVLGIDEGTVKSRLARARAVLGPLLHAPGGDR
jgi:RNA polymerase sigma-70 factor (ECF subfamily)